MRKTLLLLIYIIIIEAALVNGVVSETLTLVSNGCSDPVNCEAVIQVDVGDEIIVISDKPKNKEFEMEFLGGVGFKKMKGYSLEIGSFQNIEYYEPVYDYKIEKIVYDKNVSGCPGELTEKNFTCEKEYSVRYVKQNALMIKSELVYGDFWGSTLQANRTYYIRLKGQKQIRLGRNDVDWVLTFNGMRYDEWAWWDTSWIKRDCFTIENESGTNVSAGYLIDLNSNDLNFSSLCTQANFYDCMGGLIYNGVPIPLSLESIDSNKGWFELQVGLNDGVTSPVSEAGYCLYYDNVSATEPIITTDFYSPAIDFNSSISGDTNETFSLHHFENNLSDSSKHLRGGTVVGGWSGYSDSNVQYGQLGAGSFSDAKYFTVPLEVIPEGTLEFWFRDPLLDTANDVSVPISTSERQLELQIKSAVGSPYTNSIHILTITGPVFNLDCDISANQWFHFAFTWDGADVNAYLDGVLCDSAEVAWSMSGSSITIGRITGIPGYPFLGALDELRISTYVKRSFQTTIPPNQVYFTKTFSGEEGVPVVEPDTNITQPNVLGVMIAGGSVYTVKFNVQDGDSNTLLVDLNYSLSTTEGDGVEIINDMNTTGASITCDDSDFSDVTNCEYLWTVAGIDGNRFITVLVTDEGGNTAFDVSDFNIMIDNIVPVLSNPEPSTNFDINWATNIDANADYTETNPYYCVTTPSVNDVNSADENASLSGGKCDYTYTGTLDCEDEIEFYFVMHDITEQTSAILQTATMDYNCGVIDFAPEIVTLTISPYVIVSTSTLVINLDINDNDYGSLTNTGYWQRSTDSINFVTFENASITYSSSVGTLHTYIVGQPTLSTSSLAEGDFLRLRVTTDDGVNATDIVNSNTISYSEDISAVVNISPVVDLNAINPSRSETDVDVNDLISMFTGLLFGLGTSAVAFYLIMKIDIHPIKEILILLFLFTMGNFLGAFGTLLNIPILNNVTGFMLGMFLLVFWVGMWLFKS